MQESLVENQSDVDAQQRAIFKTLLHDFELWVANRDVRQSYYTQAEQLKILIEELQSWTNFEVQVTDYTENLSSDAIAKQLQEGSLTYYHYLHKAHCYWVAFAKHFDAPLEADFSQWLTHTKKTKQTWTNYWLSPLDIYQAPTYLHSANTTSKTEFSWRLFTELAKKIASSVAETPLLTTLSALAVFVRYCQVEAQYPPGEFQISNLPGNYTVPKPLFFKAKSELGIVSLRDIGAEFGAQRYQIYSFQLAPNGKLIETFLPADISVAPTYNLAADFFSDNSQEQTEYIVAWSDDYKIKFAIFNSNHSVKVSTVTLETGNANSRPWVVRQDQSALLFWRSWWLAPGIGNDILSLQILPNGELQGNSMHTPPVNKVNQIDGNLLNMVRACPVYDQSDLLNQAAVFWGARNNSNLNENIYHTQVSSLGTPTWTLEQLVPANSAPNQVSYGCLAQLDNKLIAKVWLSYTGYNLYGRLFFSNGTAVTDDIMINTENSSGLQIECSIAPHTNGFILLYSSNEDDSTKYNIYAKYYDNDFNSVLPRKKLSETNLPSRTAYFYPNPHVTYLGLHQFFSTWSSNNPADSQVYGRFLSLKPTLIFQKDSHTYEQGEPYSLPPVAIRFPYWQDTTTNATIQISHSSEAGEFAFADPSLVVDHQPGFYTLIGSEIGLYQTLQNMTFHASSGFVQPFNVTFNATQGTEAFICVQGFSDPAACTWQMQPYRTWSAQPISHTLDERQSAMIEGNILGNETLARVVTVNGQTLTTPTEIKTTYGTWRITSEGAYRYEFNTMEARRCGQGESITEGFNYTIASQNASLQIQQPLGNVALTINCKNNPPYFTAPSFQRFDIVEGQTFRLAIKAQDDDRNDAIKHYTLLDYVNGSPQPASWVTYDGEYLTITPPVGASNQVLVLAAHDHYSGYAPIIFDVRIKKLSITPQPSPNPTPSASAPLDYTPLAAATQGKALKLTIAVDTSKDKFYLPPTLPPGVQVEFDPVKGEVIVQGQGEDVLDWAKTIKYAPVEPGHTSGVKLTIEVENEPPVTMDMEIDVPPNHAPQHNHVFRPMTFQRHTTQVIPVAKYFLDVDEDQLYFEAQAFPSSAVMLYWNSTYLTIRGLTPGSVVVNITASDLQAKATQQLMLQILGDSDNEKSGSAFAPWIALGIAVGGVCGFALVCFCIDRLGFTLYELYNRKRQTIPTTTDEYPRLFGKNKANSILPLNIADTPSVGDKTNQILVKSKASPTSPLDTKINAFSFFNSSPDSSNDDQQSSRTSEQSKANSSSPFSDKTDILNYLSSPGTPTSDRPRQISVSSKASSYSPKSDESKEFSLNSLNSFASQSTSLERTLSRSHRLYDYLDFTVNKRESIASDESSEASSQIDEEGFLKIMV